MIMVDYDVILNDLGPMTTAQKAQLVLVLLPGILAAMHMAGMMFLGYNQSHLCSMPLKDEIIQVGGCFMATTGLIWRDECGAF